MTEHKTCEGCKWNHYPECLGTIMFDGSFMKIDNLRPNFRCGQKDMDIITDFSIKYKSELEKRVEALEEKTKDLDKEVK